MGDLSAKNVDCESLTFQTYFVRIKQLSGQTSEQERDGSGGGRLGGGGRREAANDKITKKIIGRFSTIREGIRSDLFWNKEKKKKKEEKRFRCACFGREIYVD